MKIKFNWDTGDSVGVKGLKYGNIPDSSWKSIRLILLILPDIKNRKISNTKSFDK